MITVTPGDPNYEWIDPREREEKYPWDEWLDNRPHMLTQYEDFHSELSTMVALVRRKSAKRDLKIVLARGFDSQYNTVLSVCSYPAGQPKPIVPKPRFQTVGTKRINTFLLSEGLHGEPIIRDNEQHSNTAEDQLAAINKAREAASQAPYEHPRCKYCNDPLSTNAEPYGECFRYGQFTHTEHHENDR